MHARIYGELSWLQDLPLGLFEHLDSVESFDRDA
ncbi:MAG: hypothetical protein JWO07_823 [Candidatus Saccharibacteria bacterium]|nr:hypothetical protein [Candidatus Saccharibacteria bacterium]